MPLFRLLIAFGAIWLIRAVTVWVSRKSVGPASHLVTGAPLFWKLRWTASVVGWIVAVYATVLILQRYVTPSVGSLALALLPFLVHAVLCEKDRRNADTWRFTVQSKVVAFVMFVVAFTVVAVSGWLFPDPFASLGYVWTPQ